MSNQMHAEHQHNAMPGFSTHMDWKDRFVLVPQDQPQIARDLEFGLEWRIAPEPEEMTWPDAVAHAWREAQRDGSGWRLPTVEELASLTQVLTEDKAGRKTTQDAVGTVILPSWCQAQRGVFWSSSPVLGESGHAWGVYFGDGFVFHLHRGGRWRVRLVRAA